MMAELYLLGRGQVYTQLSYSIYVLQFKGRLLKLSPKSAFCGPQKIQVFKKEAGNATFS